MTVSAAGRRLAMHIIGVEEQKVLAGLGRWGRLRQGKNEEGNKGE